MDALTRLGKSEDIDVEIVNKIERFVCLMYNTQAKNVDDARIEVFSKIYGQKSTKDPLKSIKSVNGSYLPPCSRVLYMKIKRVDQVSFVAFVTKYLRTINPPSLFLIVFY